MHVRIAKWIGILFLWAFVGLVLSTEVYFNVHLHEPEISFADVAAPQYLRAIYWALLTPLILGLHARIPLKRNNWARGIAFHLATSFIFMAQFYLARILWHMLSKGQPLTGFWMWVHMGFSGHNLIDMVFYWAVVAYGYTLALQQRVKDKELKEVQLESCLIEAELKVLKHQLHPHFLFNTLNTVSVLVREKSNDDAVNLIARLSALLRMSLESTRVHEVTLRQEMEFLDQYLEIQKMRFLDRLNIKTTIAVSAFDARIPNLLLQPIVENAIVHGVAPKQGPGHIEITGNVRDGLLCLDVRDDGPGLPEDCKQSLEEGIGLSNTRERLAKMYGGKGLLSFKSERGQGTTVSISLPYRA